MIKWPLIREAKSRARRGRRFDQSYRW